MAGDIDVLPHLDDLWRYARFLTRNDADADDLLQEALARAIRMSGSYDPSRPLIGWLVTIVRTTFLSSRRRAAAEAARIEVVARLGRDAAAPDQEEAAELKAVMRAVDALPPDQSEVLHLVAVLGFTYADTAEALGVPAGTVMSRLNRARTTLKARIGYGRDGAGQRLKLVGGRDDD